MFVRQRGETLVVDVVVVIVVVFEWLGLVVCGVVGMVNELLLLFDGGFIMFCVI